VIVVLCPGVDPSETLRREAESQDIIFESISMGRGASERATKTLTEGADPAQSGGNGKGRWIFLANCHLCIALLPELEAIVDQLLKSEIAQGFRLILSAMPHPQFSISLLQRSLKVAQEPPKGIKSNLLRIYASKQAFHEVDPTKAKDFRKALFGLAWFHTILIERKKFKSLGWCVNYAFNDSDFSVCEDLLAL